MRGYRFCVLCGVILVFRR